MITEAIDSARRQTWPREILIINDGSDDGTADLLQTLDGVDGIRVIHKENGGKPSALNMGIEAAKGEALIVLDDDDMLAPGSLHLLGTALVNRPDLGVVNGDTLCFDGKSGRPKVYMPASRLPDKTGRQAVLQQVPAMPGASLIRMTTQRAAGLYDLSLIRGQDMDMYLRLSRHGGVDTVPFPTFFYRAHDGLRGSASGQWRRSQTEAHKDKFMACVSPIFEKRYQAERPSMSRAMGHSWALGLHLRRLPELAQAELKRWPGPYSKRECWMRTQIGLKSEETRPDRAMVVVDDGDPGALEETLERHAAGHTLWVDLEVPRDPLGNIRLYWPGEYSARERLAGWVQGEGPIHIRLSSAPDWAPPAISTAAWFPDLPAVDAVLAVAAAKSWPAPNRCRHGARAPIHPHVLSLWRVRGFLNENRPDQALSTLLPVLKAMPAWPGVWQMAAEAYQSRGDSDKAKRWMDRVEGLAAAG
jgi:glycosyltransferase involved in cell wall biosynthesis